jgi:hypothetical protein
MTMEHTPTESTVVGPETVLRRVPDVAWTPIADEIVVHRVLTTTSWVLNPMAGLVWQCLDGESSVEEILGDVAEVFAVNEAHVRDDFLPILEVWVREGIAEEPARPFDPVTALKDVRLAGFDRYRRIELAPNDCNKALKSRWPYHLAIEVDGAVLTVASDDPAVVEALRPWQLDLDTELVDYILQLDPPTGARTGHRGLPTITRGCQPLFRIRDRMELRRAFWRLLASFARTQHPSEVRIQLMPLVHEGRALLVPPSHAGAISHRWYAKAGITPIYTAASVIDADGWTVRTDASLVAEPDTNGGALDGIPILDWWLPAAVPDYDLPRGEALAHVMRLAVGVDDDNAGDVLRAASRLVSECLPGLAPVAPDRYTEALSRSWADVMRREVFDAIVARFEAGEEPGYEAAATRSTGS